MLSPGTVVRPSGKTDYLVCVCVCVYAFSERERGGVGVLGGGFDNVIRGRVERVGERREKR